ncbi:MAG: purine-nucleoside phosphorylase [Desulfobacteraceae bacterium]|nr:purine-nucleoside phosphorylase [Desulfobacteraceae bacterium]
MENYRQTVQETAAFLKKHLKHPPVVGVLTGTGLSQSIQSLDITQSFDYALIPHFPVSTVKSHAGKLGFGQLAKTPMMIMQGRFHLYEGYTPSQVVFPVRVMQELGVKILIITNAAGGLNLNFTPGDLMIITDHINLTGQNPLIGPNEDQWGIRFPDMTKVYDKNLMETAKQCAQKNQINLKEGVYAGLTGPSLETPAETRFLKTIGSHAVGFSTILEAIAGVHAGMRILGISLISNLNDPDDPCETTLEGVLQIAEKSVQKLDLLISAIVTEL